jgi:hypothetical protein
MPQQLPKDRPTAADKKREQDLINALQKEDFYGKKKAPAKASPKPVVKVTKVQMSVDRPTAADKKREDDLVKALQKEKFYESPLMRAAKAKKQ